jgi:outer membrane protein insertion porin family
MKKTNDNNIINLFRTKKFVAEEFENDKKAVIEKYNECGYRDAYIVSDSIAPNPEDPTRVDVYMTISEGNKYHVRSIKWVGNTVYPYEILDASLGIKPGDVYNLKILNERLQSDDDAVSKLYTDRGYLFFNVEPVEVNVENDSIDFEMRMYEGKPATINEVKIVGNTRVYEHVVRRELYTKPGQLYSQSDIMRSLRELAQMGHFDQEKLVPDIQPNPEEGTVDITYQLETKSSDQIEFSLGWGATGLVGSLGLKFTNFAIQNLFNKKSYRIVPQGEGQTFSVNARTNGIYYTSASISFLEPWLGGKRPNSLSASIYFANQTGYSKRYESAYQNLYNTYSNYYYYSGNSNYYQQLLESEYDEDRYLRTLGASIGYGVSVRNSDVVSLSRPVSARRLAVPPRSRVALPPAVFVSDDGVENRYDYFNIRLDKNDYPLRVWESMTFDEAASPVKNRFIIRYSSDDKFKHYSTVEFSLYLRELIGLGFFTRRVSGDIISNYDERTIFGRAELK